MDSTVPFAELKPGGERLLERIEAPPPLADPKFRDATPGTIVYQDADECLTFESAPVRSGRIRCAGSFAKNRHVLRAREELITRETVIVGQSFLAETRFFLQGIME